MLLALDIETTGLNPFKNDVLCVGVYSPETGYRCFFDLEEFRGWHRKDHEYICHNGKFDISFLRRKGIDLRESFRYDTRSIATILIPSPNLSADQRRIYSIQNLYLELLHGEHYKIALTNLKDIPREDLVAYNKKDCEVTWQLFDYLLKRFPPKDWEFVESWLMPATHLCMDMEYNGILIDRDGLEAYREIAVGTLNSTLQLLLSYTEEPRRVWREKQIELLAKTYESLSNKAIVKAKDKEKTRTRYQSLFEKAKERLAPFNFHSVSQIKWLLSEHYGLSLINDRTEKETTDNAMLKVHAVKNEACKALLDFRDKEKLLQSSIPALLDNIAPDLRVHPSFNIGGTRTGRLSSSNPNVQQIPRGKLRSYIKASPGYQFYISDFAQIEVRIMAELAEEEELINAFKQQIDPYSVIAKKLLQIDLPVEEIKSKMPKERNVSKTAGLSILYGSGASRLQEVLRRDLGRDLCLREVKTFIEDFRNSFRRIKDYKLKLERLLANRGKIYNLLGRPFYMPSNDDLYMKALNTMVQGSSSDLVVHAVINICREFPFINPVMLIHDEMVLEIPEDRLSIVGRIEEIATVDMERDFKMRVPLKIEHTLSQEWEKP